MLLDIQAQTGITADELLNMPTLPPGVEYLWEWFQALANRRGSGMSVEAITWGDIESFFRLIGVKPARWELRALTALDDAYLFSRSDEGGKRVIGSAGTLRGIMPGKPEVGTPDAKPKVEGAGNV